MFLRFSDKDQPPLKFQALTYISLIVLWEDCVSDTIISLGHKSEISRNEINPIVGFIKR